MIVRQRVGAAFAISQCICCRQPCAQQEAGVASACLLQLQQARGCAGALADVRAMAGGDVCIWLSACSQLVLARGLLPNQRVAQIAFAAA